jgi:dTDP-4-amino-4,6-dideoxygalactose transaminase
MEFTQRRTMADTEKKAVMEVMETGELSAFFGSPGPQWLGGEKVRQFERKWADNYGYKHAISVNSWTTGLMTAVGAMGIGPGDEVIVSPYTMSASATAILFYGGIPVFADDASCVAWSVANSDLAQIETPGMPDRTQWLYDLSAAHWTDAESRSGNIYRHFLSWI